MTQTTSETASGGTAFQARPKVAVVYATPDTVLDDVALRPEADAVLRELAAAATQRSV